MLQNNKAIDLQTCRCGSPGGRVVPGILQRNGSPGERLIPGKELSRRSAGRRIVPEKSSRGRIFRKDGFPGFEQIFMHRRHY